MHYLSYDRRLATLFGQYLIKAAEGPKIWGATANRLSIFASVLFSVPTKIWRTMALWPRCFRRPWFNQGPLTYRKLRFSQKKKKGKKKTQANVRLCMNTKCYLARKFGLWWQTMHTMGGYFFGATLQIAFNIKFTRYRGQDV